MDIFEVLNKCGIEYTQVSDIEIKMSCMSGLHEDKVPSLHYNLDRNVFKCFSCDYKGGAKTFMKGLGEDPESLDSIERVDFKIQKLRNKFDKKMMLEKGIMMPALTVPFKGDFRDIFSDVWEEFGAFETQQWELDNYVCIPVTQYGKIKFIEARYKLASGAENKPKYMRKPDGSAVKNILFPIDRCSFDPSRTLVLVEGLTDMLNLWQWGVKNVTCIFGANNFGKEKIGTLKDFNIKRCVILMDGDPAGRKAADTIANLLAQHNIEPVVFNLKDGEDPGSLSKQRIEEIFKK